MTVKPGTKTILEIIKAAENLFREKAVTNPRLSAELLMADTLKTERINLYMNFDKPLNEQELERYRQLVKRRLNHEPLQYIVGEAHFYGRKFLVNRSVLIPRPETELLVEKTIEIIKDKKLEHPEILEIGTGSGCISISIAAEVECSIDAIDLNSEIISAAIDNAKLNGADDRVRFSEKDFMSNSISAENYDIIISNPPYIPADEFNTLPNEIRDYEPGHALTDNLDGLEFYRRIFTLYNAAAKKPAVILEIGDGKKEKVEKTAGEYSIKNYFFHKDLLGIYRVFTF